jgi:hypothetical protein
VTTKLSPWSFAIEIRLQVFELTVPSKGYEVFSRRIDGPFAGAGTSVPAISFNSLFECEYRGYARGV